MNFICGSEDYPEGVLIRAVKPVNGVEKMKARRGRNQNIADGPGKLTEALDIRKEDMNGKNFSKTELEVEEGENSELVTDKRIGISSAKEWPLRFCRENSNYLSKPVREPSDPENSLEYVEDKL